MKALEVKNVSIAYMTGDFRNIGIKEFFMRKLKGNYEVQKFWADKNINFDLEKGDMLGIVGTNGAGKSTLLKAVTGIMVPTEGKVKVRGKVAALLELASGVVRLVFEAVVVCIEVLHLGHVRDKADHFFAEMLSHFLLVDDLVFGKGVEECHQDGPAAQSDLLEQDTTGFERVDKLLYSVGIASVAAGFYTF